MWHVIALNSLRTASIAPRICIHANSRHICVRARVRVSDPTEQNLPNTHVCIHCTSFDSIMQIPQISSTSIHIRMHEHDAQRISRRPFECEMGNRISHNHYFRGCSSLVCSPDIAPPPPPGEQLVDVQIMHAHTGKSASLSSQKQHCVHRRTETASAPNARTQKRPGILQFTYD